MVTCPNCQSSMSSDADFCGYCGGRLDQEGDGAGAPSRISTQSSHKPTAEEGWEPPDDQSLEEFTRVVTDDFASGRSRQDVVADLVTHDGWPEQPASEFAEQVERHRQDRRDLDDVPGWLGWIAFPLGYLTNILGLSLYSYWAYRRGRRDGVGRRPVEDPNPRFGEKAIMWGLLTLLALLVPFWGWYVFAHLPTICYKQGLRVGANEGTSSLRFTSLPALGGVFVGVIITAIFLITIVALASA